MIALPQPPQFTVTPDAMRPASPERRCFYCRQPVGGIHGPECVLVSQMAVLRMQLGDFVALDFRLSVPWHWDKDRTEFRYNTGTWCADNVLQHLEGQPREVRDGLASALRHVRRQRGCLCEISTVSVLSLDGAAFLEER